MMIRMVGGWVFLLVPAHPDSHRQTAVKRLLLLLQLIKETEMTIQMWSACTTVVDTINNILLKCFSLPSLSGTEYFFYMPKSSLCISTLYKKEWTDNSKWAQYLGTSIHNTDVIADRPSDICRQRRPHFPYYHHLQHITTTVIIIMIIIYYLFKLTNETPIKLHHCLVIFHINICSTTLSEWVVL